MTLGNTFCHFLLINTAVSLLCAVIHPVQLMKNIHILSGRSCVELFHSLEMKGIYWSHFISRILLEWWTFFFKTSFDSVYIQSTTIGQNIITKYEWRVKVKINNKCIKSEFTQYTIHISFVSHAVLVSVKKRPTF